MLLTLCLCTVSFWDSKWVSNPAKLIMINSLPMALTKADMHQISLRVEFQFLTHSCNLTKGGLKSEGSGRFSNCPKNVPKNYPELLHSVHCNDEILVLNYQSFKIQLKNANDTTYVEFVKCFKFIGLFIMLLEPIVEPVNRLNL